MFSLIFHYNYFFFLTEFSWNYDFMLYGNKKVSNQVCIFIILA